MLLTCSLSTLFFFVIADSAISAPVGLVNITGNSCFANSMTQALFHIPSLRQAMANFSPTGHEGGLFNQVIHNEFKAAFQKLSVKARNPEMLTDLYNSFRSEGIVNVTNPGDGMCILLSFFNRALSKNIQKDNVQFEYKTEYEYNNIFYPLNSPLNLQIFLGLNFVNSGGSRDFGEIVRKNLLLKGSNFYPEEKAQIDADRLTAGLEAVNWNSANLPQRVERLFLNKIFIITLSVNSQTGECGYIDRSTVPLKMALNNKQYHLISATLSLGGHATAVVKTDPLNNKGWYSLNDSLVREIDEAGVKEHLKKGYYFFYVEESEVESWGVKSLVPKKISSVVSGSGNATNSGSNSGTNVGSNGSSSGGVPSGASNSGSNGGSSSGPSGNSSGASSGGSSSGSNGGSSSDSKSDDPKSNASSRTPSPSTPSKTSNKSTPNTSRPIYKSPMFIGCSVGALITVTAVAALVMARLHL